MEFKIKIFEKLSGYAQCRIAYKLPSELTTPERIELIKQLCLEINSWATDFVILDSEIDFIDYLAEQMLNERQQS